MPAPAQWVRFDADLSVPLEAIIFVSTIPGAECLCLRGKSEPIPLGPGNAERWQAFVSGGVEYPVNVNGVLDLTGNQEAQFIAERVLAGQPSSPPLVFGAPEPVAPQTAPSAPKIDFAKVRSRMK